MTRIERTAKRRCPGALAAAAGVEALRTRAPQDGPLARSQRVSNRRLREASGWEPRMRAGTELWARIAA